MKRCRCQSVRKFVLGLVLGLGAVGFGLCPSRAQQSGGAFISTEANHLPGDPTDPIIENIVHLLDQRLNPYIQTALQREAEGQYAQALQMYQQLLKQVKDPSVFAHAVEGLPQSLGEEVKQYLAHNPNSHLLDPSNADEIAIHDGLDNISQRFNGYLCCGYAGIVHILFLEGRYSEALSKAEEGTEASKPFSDWTYTLGGKTYSYAQWAHSQRWDYSQKGKLLHYVLPYNNGRGENLSYDVCLDIALCYYQLREYEQARDQFLTSWYAQLGGGLEDYAKRFTTDFQQVGYKELGAILYLAESSNTIGSSHCPITFPPDPRYSSNYEQGLQYAQKAYELMPNNLDICMQVYVLLCTLHRYQEAIEVWRHMYALVQKGPSAYEAVDPGLMQHLWGCLVFVPDTEWEAWKRAHGGRDAYPNQ